MGVTGLWKLIESSGKPVPLETLENKVLAIDISIWLHQVVKGYQDNKGGHLHNAHLLGLFNRICKLLYFRIKPIFVFDGAVPELKRQTIAKRAQQKTKIQSEAERLEQLLLQSLAKEKILKQVLGDPEKLILSPTKQSRARATRSEERDNIYKLPDSVDNVKREVKEEDEEDEDEDEMCPKRMYDVNIAQIDVNSPHFLSLPPDIRHEILNDIKETRKQNSWGRLKELPVEAPDFSTYQMSRLLRRRQVQIGLEEAEKEMGGKSWSLAELENLLSEDGVLEANSKHYQKIASNEHARFMLVKDIAQSMKLAKEEPEAKGPQPSTSSATTECLDDEDLDLQRALQLSLGTDPGSLVDEQANIEQRAKLNQKQRQKFGGTIQAHGLIRGFMMEYAQMNDNDINDMLEVTQAEVEEEKNSVDVDSTLTETAATASEGSRKVAEKEDPPRAHNSNANTGSDSDEDFLEIESDSACEKERKDKIVISFDPNLSDYQESEDLFADLFEKPTEKVQEPPSEDELCDVEVGSISSDDDTLPYELPEEDLHDIEQISISEAEADDEKIQAGPSEESSMKPKFSEEETIKTAPIEKVVTKSLPVASAAFPTEDKVAETINGLGENKFAETESEDDSPELIEQDVIFKNSPVIIESDEETPEIATHVTPAIESVKPPIVKDPLQILRETKTVEELEQMRTDLKADQKNLSEARNKFDRMGANITDSMCRDCKELLKLFGIPYIDAPMEAEAQCAFLNAMKLTDGTISDDSDIWLFGGQTVYKNFFVQKKIVMEFNEGSIEEMFHLDRKKLIQLAMLVGSDYTVGINGIGAVTALEILAAFPPSSEEAGVDQYQALVSSLRKFREWFSNGKQVGPGGRTLLKSKLKNVELFEGFPNLSIAKAYLEPIVDESLDKFSWGPPDKESLIEYAKTKLSWTRMKTEEILSPVMKRLNEKKQATIKDYFKSQVTKKFFDSNKLSKRVQKAVGKMGGCEEEEPEKKEKPKKAQKRRAPAKKSKSKEAAKLSTDEAVVVLSDDDDVEQDEVPDKKPSPERPSEPQPSTSKSENSLFKAMTKKPTKRAASPATKVSERPKRTVRIPETKQVIPQREKDKEEQNKAKLKAIEIFKKAKK